MESERTDVAVDGLGKVKSISEWITPCDPEVELLPAEADTANKAPEPSDDGLSFVTAPWIFVGAQTAIGVSDDADPIGIQVSAVGD